MCAFLYRENSWRQFGNPINHKCRYNVIIFINISRFKIIIFYLIIKIITITINLVCDANIHNIETLYDPLHHCGRRETLLSLIYRDPVRSSVGSILWLTFSRTHARKFMQHSPTAILWPSLTILWPSLFFFAYLPSPNLGLHPRDLQSICPWIRCLQGEQQSLYQNIRQITQDRSQTKDTHPNPGQKLKFLTPPGIEPVPPRVGRQGLYQPRHGDLWPSLTIQKDGDGLTVIQVVPKLDIRL